MSRTKLTPEALASVRGMSARQAASKLGVGKTTITDARAKLEPKLDGGKSSSLDEKLDGSLIVSTTDSVPQTKDHIEERMRSRGFDPQVYTFTYGFSEWEAQTAKGVQTMYSARASARERTERAGLTPLTEDEISAIVYSYQPVGYEAPEPGSFEPNTFIYHFADPQLGKTDINGGSDQTIARFVGSIDKACSLLERDPATEIVFSDLGDIIENFFNTSSQRETNDLNLTQQVRLARRLSLYGIQRLSEYAPVVHVSVPSNHAQTRVGFQMPASTAHDDWGIEVQAQLSDIYDIARDTFKHEVSFLAPPEHLESVAYTTVDGTVLGFVHGHRAGQQNNLERWWAGQSLGRQPVAEADILLVGHFHNYSVTSVGSERYIVVAPSLDNGSSWFTVSRGSVSTAGALTSRVRNKFPYNMEIC